MWMETKQMPIIIRYVASEGRDFYIAPSPHHDNGVWVHDRGLAMSFENEAKAKRFMVRNGYILSPDLIVFEPAVVSRDALGRTWTDVMSMEGLI